jgi:hypothetical protein
MSFTVLFEYIIIRIDFINCLKGPKLLGYGQYYTLYMRFTITDSFFI